MEEAQTQIEAEQMAAEESRRTPLIFKIIINGQRHVLRWAKHGTSLVPVTVVGEEMNNSPFGPVIFSYTRAQAIADGVLVDASGAANEVGFRHPFAFTAAAWSECVAWSDADSQRQTVQDERGRLLDVLWLAKLAARNGQGSVMVFDVRRVPRDGHSVYPHRMRLQLVIGPGDAGEPVLTVMLPEED